MGTGRGKSLFIQLPARLSGPESLTIVLVPLLALQQDLIRLDKALGLRSAS